MKIASTQYSANTKSFEIYLSGCDGRCGDACHNRELWDFNIGDDYEDVIGNIVVKINEFNKLIDWIWVLGGEPLLQDKNELKDMFEILKSLTNKPIMLWTSYKYDEIPKDVLKLCDYVKTGMYLPEYGEGNEQYGIKLATANQKILKLNVN